MNPIRIFLSGWLILLSFQLQAQCVQSFKVLHYTETTGYDHNTRSFSQSMFEGMGLLENFEVVTDNNGDQFSSLDSLNQYAVVIFSNTSGNSGLDSTQRENFKTYMLNGGGFLGIHAAGDAYRHSVANGNNTGVWDWYPENLTGASVRMGPSHTSWSHVDTLFKAAPPHPSLDNIPDPWVKQEEYYYWEDGYLDTTFTPILGVTTTGNNYYDIPRMMAQIKELPGGGRAFYTGLGHAPVNYTSDTIFQRLILDALLWVSEPSLPSSLEASIEVSQLPCSATGTASVVSLDSTQLLSYSWSTGDTTSSVSFSVPGVYTVTISNSSGCTKVDSVEIQSGSQVSPQLSTLNDISCFNGADGAIEVSLSGGIQEFNILWSTGDTTETITGLAAGIYAVAVTDTAGCAGLDSISLTEPSQLIATASAPVQLTCFGDSTATIKVVGTGGTGIYAYSWSNGATTKKQFLMAAGSYIGTITDANGCTATDSITLTDPPQLTATATIANAIDCFGQTGSAAVSGAGGTGTLSYLWSSGSTAATPGNLSAGTYSVTITDANGCTATDNITLTDPPQLIATATIVNAIDCFGLTGSAAVSGAGGTGTLSYLWSNGSTAATPGNLSAGTYSVIITDANGCTATDNITLTDPPQLIATATIANAINCFGQTGSAAVSGTGGTGTLSYLWSNGSTAATPGNLSAGTYSVTITDANGCTATDSITLTDPPQLIATATIANAIDCFGQTGSAAVSGTGGTGTLSYLWSNGSTAATPGNLSAGTYSVTITDANGCTATDSVALTDPPQLIATATIANAIDCFGQTGSAAVSGTGGTGTLSYLWSNGSTAATPGNLSAGTYSVTITDANGCTATDNITLTNPPQLIATATIVNAIDCFGQTGSGAVSGTGGTGTLSYLWSNGSTAATPGNLAAGTYSVTITDANGCTATDSVAFIQPDEIQSNISVLQQVDCSNKGGEVSLTISGGSPGYTVLWENGDNSLVRDSLGAGAYVALITDANGCTLSDTVILSSNTPIVSSLTPGQEIFCFGDSTGEAVLQISGGQAPYIIQWNDGDSALVKSGLGAGSYSVVIEDGMGCVTSDSITINSPDKLVPTVSMVQPISCFGAGDAVVELSVSGGTAPINFLWNNGDTTAILMNQSAGNITVMVTDSAGCMADGELVISQPDSLLISTQVVADSSCTTPAGEISITVQGGTSPYQATLTSTGTGDSQVDSTGILAFVELDQGEYLLRITDANGCVVEDSVEVVDGCEQKDRLEEMMGVESWIVSLSADKKFIQVEVVFLQPNPMTLSVRDIHGRLISEYAVPDGRNIREHLPTNRLTKGVYLIQITTPEASAIRKIVLR